MKPYLTRITALATVLAVILSVLLKTGLVKITFPCFAGLVFLYLLNLSIWYFVNGNPKRSAAAVVRRLMLASFIRMFGAAIFLAITLLTVKPLDKIFVWTYFIVFCAFLVFEIWETRSKLRPDSKQRSLDKNA